MQRVFRRKNIRLPADRYRGKGMYFVTLCFANRHRFGANHHLASWIVASIRKHAAACDFYVHAYCVMPDHVHMLAAGATSQSSLIKFVEALKQDTAVAFARQMNRPLWQTKYYDHILRTSDSADRVAWYIWLNPVRQGLCRTPADYQSLGSFTDIGTKMLQSSVHIEWTPPWKPGAPATAALQSAPSCEPEMRKPTALKPQLDVES